MKIAFFKHHESSAFEQNRLFEALCMYSLGSLGCQRAEMFVNRRLQEL